MVNETNILKEKQLMFLKELTTLSKRYGIRLMSSDSDDVWLGPIDNVGNEKEWFDNVQWKDGRYVGH